MLPAPRTYAFWLALLRIYMGLFWLEHGVGKLLSHPAFGAPDGAMAQIVGTYITKTHGAYHDFLATVVVPNTAQFAFAVELGELAAGVLLLFGFLSRLGGLIGVVLALNYWAMKGDLTGFSPYAGLDILTAVASAVHLVLPTGRYLGLDGLLSHRSRRLLVSATTETLLPPPRPVGREPTGGGPQRPA